MKKCWEVYISASRCVNIFYKGRREKARRAMRHASGVCLCAPGYPWNTLYYFMPKKSSMMLLSS